MGGNVQIISVSNGSPPQERASILNCSRSGALFRIQSARSFFRKTKDPLEVRDSLSCVLRMPPHYTNIELLAEVVRVERPSEDPQGVHVGVRFFLPEAPLRRDPNVASLRRVLGKAGFSSEEQALPLEPEPERKSARVSSRSRRVSRRSRRVSAEGSSSQRKPTQTSRRLQSPEPELEGRNKTRRVRVIREEPEPREEVADALRADLFQEDSWSNYLLGASLEGSDGLEAKREPAEPKAPAVKILPEPPPGGPHREAPNREPHIGVPQSEATIVASPEPKAPAPEPKRTSRRVPSATSSAKIPTAAPAAPVIYSSLGGPENGLYVRGSAILLDGEARVRLPAHFSGLIDEHTLTVQITPRGPCRGLYVSRATGRGVIVKELFEGTSCAPFDYLVLAQRRPS